MSTSITVVGTIATDPRLVKPAGDMQLCSFRLASDERRYDRDKQAWVEGHTNWFGVVCFRGLAANAHDSFRKGDRIIINGKLRVRNWENNDKRGTSVEIEADAIGHDLRWGVSSFDKRAGSAAADTNAESTGEGDGEGDGEGGLESDREGATSEVIHNAGGEELQADGFTPQIPVAA